MHRVFNKYKTIVKSLTSLEIEITEMIKRHQHITKLQSELIQEKKVYWTKTRWGYIKALLSWENKIWVTATSCHTRNLISCKIYKSWQNSKHDTIHSTNHTT